MPFMSAVMQYWVYVSTQSEACLTLELKFLKILGNTLEILSSSCQLEQKYVRTDFTSGSFSASFIRHNFVTEKNSERWLLLFPYFY